MFLSLSGLVSELRVLTWGGRVLTCGDALPPISRRVAYYQLNRFQTNSKATAAGSVELKR